MRNRLRHARGSRPSPIGGDIALAFRGATAALLIAGVGGCSADGGNDVAAGGSSGALGTAGSGAFGGTNIGAGGIGVAGANGGATFVGSGGQPSSAGSGGQVGSGGMVSNPGAGGLPVGSGGLGSVGGTANGGSGGSIATGGAGGGVAGAAGAGDPGNTECSGGKTLVASDAAGSGGTRVTGYGEVQFQLPTTAQPIVELRTTLIVPARPTTSSTLFIWPGLEPLPGGAKYNPIGLGVLQPVLTWATSCAPNSPKNPSPTGWWISSQYVNVSTSEMAHAGCFGGKSIDVAVGDQLDITMSLKGTSWSQVVVDRQSGQMAPFDIDMGGQAQLWALFKIEIPTQTKPASDIVFTSTTLTFAGSQPMLCQPTRRGTNDYFSAPVAAVDGTKCCISKIILRAQGVAATTQNGP